MRVTDSWLSLKRTMQKNNKQLQVLKSLIRSQLRANNNRFQYLNRPPFIKSQIFRRYPPPPPRRQLLKIEWINSMCPNWTQSHLPPHIIELPRMSRVIKTNFTIPHLVLCWISTNWTETPARTNTNDGRFSNGFLDSYGKFYVQNHVCCHRKKIRIKVYKLTCLFEKLKSKIVYNKNLIWDFKKKKKAMS